MPSRACCHSGRPGPRASCSAPARVAQLQRCASALAGPEDARQTAAATPVAGSRWRASPAAQRARLVIAIALRRGAPGLPPMRYGGRQPVEGRAARVADALEALEGLESGQDRGRVGALAAL
jgi:hypothetical protein